MSDLRRAPVAPVGSAPLPVRQCDKSLDANVDWARFQGGAAAPAAKPKKK